MFAKHTKKFMLAVCLLLVTSQAYPEVQIEPIEDPNATLNIDAAVKEQLADFQEQLNEYVKNPSNIALMQQELPKFLRDYELYLKKYYTTVKAIDPTVSAYDIPYIDKIIKKKFGWSTYDLMQEYERLVEKLQVDVIPYIEAEAYEEAWNLSSNNEQIQPRTNGLEPYKADHKNDSKDNIYRYEYMIKKLNDVHANLSEYIKKWDEHQRSVIKNLDAYSKKVRSYTYGTENTVWQDRDGNFIAGENNTKAIPNVYKFSDYLGTYKNPSPNQTIGISVDYAVNFLKSAYLVDDLNGIFLIEREIAFADQYKTEINAKLLNIEMLKALLTAYKNNDPVFSNEDLKRKLEVKSWDLWFNNNFEKLHAESIAELALQKQKAEVNKLSLSRFGKEVIGSSINILLAAAAKDAIFTMLDQSDFTEWAVPKSKEEKDSDYYKLNNYAQRQMRTYKSLETWAGILTFVTTAQKVRYGGDLLIKGWEKNWEKIKLSKSSQKISTFVQQNAEKYALKLSQNSVTQKFNASKFCIKMNKMFKSSMFAAVKETTGGITKQTFRLVRGFGMFSIGFALGDRFSKYVVTNLKFSKELDLPDNDPVKIATQKLIDEINSSKGANAETTNVAISLFLSEVLFTKAAALPKYYSIMKELNKKNCKITYKMIQNVLEKNLAKQGVKNWWIQTLDPRRTTVIFAMQSYIDELFISRILFTDIRQKHIEKINELYKNLVTAEAQALIKAMLGSIDMQDLEDNIYKEFGEFVTLSSIVDELRKRHDDVKCCLDDKTNMLKASSCLTRLLKNILNPTANIFMCEDNKETAKMATSSLINDTFANNPNLSEENKEIIKAGRKNIQDAIESLLTTEDVLELITNGNFDLAKEKITNMHSHDPSTLQILFPIMDDIASSYKGKTLSIEQGLSKLEYLFTDTYPYVISSPTRSDIGFKKDVLSALAKFMYKKLILFCHNYKKDGLTGRDYLQARLYYLLKNTIIFQPETSPPYKSSVYRTIQEFGLTGVTIDKYGITDIETPSNLKLEIHNEDVIQESDSIQIK